MSVADLEDSADVLIELHRLQKTLQQKLKRLQAELTVNFTTEKELGKLNSDELCEEISVAEKKLHQQQSINANRDDIVQMSLFGQEAFKALYISEAGLDTGEHGGMTILHNKVTQKMNELADLNKQLLEKQNKTYHLETQLQSVKKRLQDVEWKNRELYALQRHADAASDTSNRQKKAEAENPKTSKLKEALDDSVKELKLRREIFLGIIQASNVDWFVDKQLRELVVSLGESLTLGAS